MVNAPQPRPGILEIQSYCDGESLFRGLTTAIKLSHNEGALGPSPKAVAAYEAQSHKLHRYPDGAHATLRSTIAEQHHLDPNKIVCGAGSDEIIGLLCRAYAGPGDEIIHSRYGFVMFALAAKICGATPVVADEVGLTTSVDHILAAVTPRTRLVFVANPNNPTGTYLTLSEIKRLRHSLPSSVLLVIDEAYAEFVGAPDYHSALSLVDDNTANLVVTRTFSKIFALGNIRLGWSYCPASVADVLNRIRNLFNVSGAALAAGTAAMEDTDHLTACRAHNDVWLAWLTQQITALPLQVTPSVCNFLLVHFPTQASRTAAECDHYLRQHGIIVRGMASYALGHCLRMTVGTETENQKLVQALTHFVDQ